MGRKGVVGTPEEREGSKKTQPEVDVLQRPIQELLEQRDRASTNEDEYGGKRTKQQDAIARVREEVQRLRRMIAGLGFGLARLKKEGDDARKENQEREYRNHELKKELRKVERKLLDLGN